MSALGSLVVKLGLEYAEYTGGLDKSEQAALAASKKIQDTFDGMKSKVAATAGAIAGGLAAGFTVAAFKNLIAGSIETGAALDDLRMQTGGTVEALSGLLAVGKFNNVGPEQLGAAMNKLSANLAGATEESKGAAKAVEALGLDFDKFRKMRPEDQMQTVAQAMSKFEDGTSKSAVAMALYGKEGAKMLPFLHDLAEVGDLQAKVTTEQAAAAANLDDNLLRLSTSGEGWKKELANGMIPALDMGVQALVDMTSGTGGLRDEVKRLVADGSIKQWTTDAIKGLSYVADVGHIAWRVLQSIGKGMGGLAAALVQALQGDFRGAWNSLKESGRDMIDVFDGPTIGARFRESLDKVAASSESAGGAAKKTALDFRNLGESAKQAKDPFDALLESITKRSAAYAAEASAGEKLTEGQKAAVEVLEQLRAGKVKVSQAQALQLGTAIELMLVQEKENIAHQEFVKTAEAERAERIKLAQAAEQGVAGLADQNKALRDEIELLGLDERAQLGVLQARNQALILTKQATLAELERQSAITGTMTREQIALEEEIRLLQERNELLGKKTDRQEGVKTAEAEKQAWGSFWQSIDTTAHDVWTNVWEGGSNMFKRLGQTLKASVLDVLYQMTVRKWMINIGTSIFGGGFGMAANAASGGGGGAGGASNVLNGASLLGKVGGTFGMGLSSGFGALFGEAGLMGALDAGAIAMGAGNVAGGLGTIMGALGPIAIGIALLASLIKKSTPHMGGGSSYSAADGLKTGKDQYTTANYGFADTRTYDATAGKLTGDVAKSVVGILDSAATSFGKQAGYAVSTAFADDKSKDGAWGSLVIGRGGKSVIDWRDTQTSKWAPKEFADGEAGSKEYLAAIAKSTREALDAMDLPGWADDMLNALGETPSLDGLASTVESINAASAALDTMGKNLVGFAGLTDEAISALVKASGGMAGLISNASTFYDNFYSPEEKKARVQRDITDKLSAVGIEGLDFNDPKAREKYRKMVEDSLAKSDEQAKNRKALTENLLGAGKGGKSLSELVGSNGWGGLDPALLGGKDDPEARKKLEGFMKDVDKVVSSGKSPAEIEASVSSLVKMNSEVLGLGEDAAATTAALLEASGAFASVTQSAEQVRAEAQASALGSLQRAVDAEKRLLDARTDAASSAVSELSGLFGLLHDNVRSLYGEVDSTAAMMAAQGSAFIAQALATARATGYLPEQDKLNDAISAARGGIGSTQYATQFEADRARLVLAGQLSELEGMAGEQLSTSERTLKELQAQSDQLDQTMQFWRDQIELSQAGVDATLSVADAVAKLQALMFPEAEKPEAAGAGAGGSGGFSIGGGGGGGAPSKPGSGFRGAGGTEINDPAAVARLTSIRAYTNTLDFSAGNKAESAADLAAAAKQYGVSASEIAIANGYRLEDVEALLAGHGVPRFDVGTNYVPRDMLAQIHEGEAIVPKAFNPWASGGAGMGGNTARLEALVEALTQRVAGLQSELAAIRGNTGGLPQLVDQFDNVTSGGNAMREVAA